MNGLQWALCAVGAVWGGWLGRREGAHIGEGVGFYGLLVGALAGEVAGFYAGTLTGWILTTTLVALAAGTAYVVKHF